MRMKTLPIRGTQAFGNSTDENMNHDLHYAHALFMAMDWYKANARHGHVAEVAVALIRKRADELMREWGFGDE